MLDFLHNNSDIVIRLGVFFLIFFMALLLKNILSQVLLRTFSFKIQKTDPEDANEFVISLKEPLGWLIFFFILRIAYIMAAFAFPQHVIVVIDKIFNTAIIITGLKLLFQFLKFIFTHVGQRDFERLEKRKTTWNYFRTALSAVVIIVGVLLVLNQWIDNLDTLIAGLGVTGLIIALAAQDTAANLVAGVAIVMDKPFEIGDWIETQTSNGLLSGSVEEIGLRSCRIRTVDNSYVTVPNNILGSAMITNGTKRSERMVSLSIPIDQQVEEGKLLIFREELRKILEEDLGVADASIKIHFMDFARDSTIWQVRYNTDIDFAVHLETRHRVNMKIWELAKALGIQLAEGVTVN